MMIFEIPQQEIFELVVKQIRNIFILNDEEKAELADNFNAVLLKVENNFSYSKNKYYHKEIISCENFANSLQGGGVVRQLTLISTLFIQHNIRFFFIIILI